MAQQATGALGKQATGALGQQATGTLGQQATGALWQQASQQAIRGLGRQGGQGTCMMPWGPKHSWKRMRPTLGSTALSGSSSSMTSAREYAALASASLAFCPPALRITQMKVSQAVLHPPPPDMSLLRQVVHTQHFKVTQLTDKLEQNSKILTSSDTSTLVANSAASCKPRVFHSLQCLTTRQKTK